MAVFTAERTARKQYECERCCRPIKPGERHIAYALTPNHDDLGNTRWLRGREHLDAGICYPKASS